MLRTAIASLFLLFAYSQSFAAPEYDEVKKASPLQQFAMDPFKESEGHIPVFYNRLSGILDRFGAPIEEVQSKLPDRMIDEVLTSYLLQYDGLTISIIESEDKEHSWPETIEISGNAYSLKYGLGVGSTRSDIVSLFQLHDFRGKGNPIRLDAEVVGYWANYKDQSGQPKWVIARLVVTFHFDALDRVEKIGLGNYGWD